jgi:hypothetical protein
MTFYFVWNIRLIPLKQPHNANSKAESQIEARIPCSTCPPFEKDVRSTTGNRWRSLEHTIEHFQECKEG